MPKDSPFKSVPKMFFYEVIELCDCHSSLILEHCHHLREKPHSH